MGFRTLYPPSGHLVADVAMWEKKIQSCKGSLSVDTRNMRNMESGELNTVKGEINGGYMDLLSIGGLK